MRSICVWFMIAVMALSFSSCSVSPTPDTENTFGASMENTDTVTDPSTHSDEMTVPETTTVTISIPEVTVIDNEYCTIKIDTIEPENINGYGLKVYLENKCTDKFLMYSLDSVAINGVETDTMFIPELTAGSNAFEYVYLMDPSPDGTIGEFTDIALAFSVYDCSDLSAPPICASSVHVYPHGEEKAVSYTRTPQDSDIVLIDNEYATAVIIGYGTDISQSFFIDLFLINKTDVTATFCADTVCINDNLANPYYSDTVGAGMCGFSTISWSKGALKENNITEIQTIAFLLRAHHETDLPADDFVSESITLDLEQ